MKKTPAEELLIGAHTSAAGGAHQALRQGAEIGATTIQFFTSNQRQWAGRAISHDELEAWKELLHEIRLKKIMSHDSYLINLGSPDPEMLAKSRTAFKEELKRCQQFGLAFLNFHPGAAVTASEEECLETIVASLEEMQDLLSHGHTKLLLETTAGQGSSVGHRFEHLGYLIERLHTKIPIGVCIDTCHIFSAGYDIRDLQGWKKTLEEFDRAIGLQYLFALHVNDSMKPLGARRDRHASLGKGEIGLESFKAMMQHPLLRELPKYLETPEGSPVWEKEIKMLREFANETH
jgi:deoxyribonuclease IV